MKENNTLPSRNEIASDYKWKLEDIYSDETKWEDDFNRLKALIPNIKEFRGTLSSSAEALYNCLLLSEKANLLSDKLFVYARMRRDEDNTNNIYQTLTDRATSLMTEVSSELSFITPEITSISEATLNGFYKNKTELKAYRIYFDNIMRQKKHILSAEQEQILALSSEMAEASSDIFSMFDNADIEFPTIKDTEGNDTELTKGRYMRFLDSHDRRVRKDAFVGFYSSYEKMRNSLGTMLVSNMKADKFYSNIRKHDSSLIQALDSDNISTDVYDNLIETVHKNLHLLHRYIELRKRILALDELHMYDLYVPIVKVPDKHIKYEDAINMVKQGMSPLGTQYVDKLQNAFSSSWIDVLENRGKTGGAYSWGEYSSHPFVLLNYQGTIKDVFTLAHEMGHALHSYYTNKSQPYIYSHYKIFVAEVASTVNENLLMNHMLKNTQNRTEKAYLLNHYLEEFRGTVFRQTMFAEFEKITHQKIESGEPLNTDSLCNIYRGLNEKYFGENVVIDPQIDMEWARIPHFYRSFYVYKYATGFCSAASICSQILENGEPSVKKYLEFLKSGSSDYPLNLLKKAGVDLTTPMPIQDGMDMFENILNQLEALL